MKEVLLAKKKKICILCPSNRIELSKCLADFRRLLKSALSSRMPMALHSAQTGSRSSFPRPIHRMAITPYRLSAKLNAIFCQEQSGPNIEVTPNTNTSYATVSISGCNLGRSHWPPSHDYPVCSVALRPGLMYQGL